LSFDSMTLEISSEILIYHLRRIGRGSPLHCNLSSKIIAISHLRQRERENFIRHNTNSNIIEHVFDAR